MKQKINGGLVFFLIVLGIYFIGLFVNFEYISKSYLGFQAMLIKILPILLGVFTFMYIINLLDFNIKKHLGKDSGLKGWIYVTLAGIIIPSPPYIVIPLLSELKEKGMKNSLIVAFLYNRNLQIAFLPVMAYYFGIKVTIIVSVYIFIFSIIGGKIIEKVIQ